MKPNSDQNGKELKSKILYWWYRALGGSHTQAEWRTRQTLSSKPIKQRTHKHFHCVCGQLLRMGERQCQTCGRLQLAPQWYHQLMRELKTYSNVTILFIIFLCIAGYGLQIAAGGSLWSGIPRNTDGMRILAIGSANALIFDQPWRLFTYTMVHGNLMHIGFNMMALYQIGPLIEVNFGRARTLFIWVVSGAFAVLLPAMIQNTIVPTIGASGSLFGFIGVAMVYGHRVGTPEGKYIRNKMIEWTVICTLFGLWVGGVAHSAHFGGLVSGGILSLFIPPPTTPSRRRISPLLVILALVFMVWSLFNTYKYANYLSSM